MLNLPPVVYTHTHIHTQTLIHNTHTIEVYCSTHTLNEGKLVSGRFATADAVVGV